MGNLLAKSQIDISKEYLETLLQTADVKIEKIVSDGHITPAGEYYNQDWNEWVAVIKGEAVLKLIEPDELITLKQGDYLFIPAHRKHRVEYTDKSGTIWLAFHFGIKTKEK